MGERRGAYKVWWGNLNGRGHLENLSLNGGIILKQSLNIFGRCGVD
jgi:hypothetical protein